MHILCWDLPVLSAFFNFFWVLSYEKLMSRLRVGICPAMTVSVLEKLRSAGIVNVIDFVSHDLDVLATKSGIGYRELASIRRVLVNEHAAPVVAGCSVFEVVVATTSIVSVGCRALDNLLEGGILTSEITEVVTDRSGVTDALVMNTIFAVVTTMCKNVVFIDTSNRFDVTRLALMLASQPDVDVENSLRRVRIVKCFDVLTLLSKLSSLCESPNLSNDSFYSSVKLVVISGIVDCIIPSLSHIHNNAGCGYVAQLVRHFRLLTTDLCYAVLLCNGDGHLAMSKNTTSARANPVGRLWCSVPATRLEVVNITGESNDSCVTDNQTTYGQVKVTVSASNRIPTGQYIELKINEHGLFT